MHRPLLAAAVAMGLSAGVAQGATLIGEQMAFRFNANVVASPVTIGAGIEILALESYSIRWTVDFDADSFVITATSFEPTDPFYAQIQFGSLTAGLIPSDPASVTFTETSVSPEIDDPDFDIGGTSFSVTGLAFSFWGYNYSGDGKVPAGTTVRWVGTIALADLEPPAVPLPASGLLLLAGLAGIGVVRARSRS